MKSRATGFTLVELLAAIAIFAVMALMAYGGLSAVLKSRAFVASSLERTAEFQKALYRLQSDFEQARARPIRDEYGDKQPALVSHDGFRDSARIEFTRGGRSNPRLQRRGSLERVAYGLEDGVLLRYSWDALDRAQDEGQSKLGLLTSVESLSWRFLDTRDTWHESWPPGDTSPVPGQDGALPQAVELQIETKDWGNIRYLFRIIATSPTPATPPVGDTP